MTVLHAMLIVVVGFYVVCAVGVRNETVMAAILICKVNSAAFRLIFAALISGRMRGIDCVCLFGDIWFDVIVIDDVIV